MTALPRKYLTLVFSLQLLMISLVFVLVQQQTRCLTKVLIQLNTTTPWTASQTECYSQVLMDLINVTFGLTMGVILIVAFLCLKQARPPKDVTVTNIQ